MNRAIRDIYFIIFKPAKEQENNIFNKRRSLDLMKELLTWHGLGNKEDIKEMEDSEILFSYIILEFGAEDGIKQRFIESRSKKTI